MTKAKKVGLALGAGSVKGFAHIGLLQVFREYGVPIDMISGSSVGAIVGAVYAVGGDMTMLGKYFSTVTSRDFLDLPRPQKGGLMSGERLHELIRIFTHNKTFQQANIPYVCTAVDVEKGELLNLTEGPLHDAVRASMSIPGVFTPVRLNGRLLVDGGVLDCVPCGQLKDMGADVVIGVDVGWNGEVITLDPPTMMAVVDQSTSIMQREITNLRTQSADLVIYPRVNYMKWFDTELADQAINEGRRAAQEAMPRIKELLEEKGISLRHG